MLESVLAYIQNQDQFALAYECIEARKQHVRDLPGWNPEKIIERIGREHYDRHMKLIQPQTRDQFFAQIAYRIELYAKNNSGDQPEDKSTWICYWALETVELLTWCAIKALVKAYSESVDKSVD